MDHSTMSTMDHANMSAMDHSTMSTMDHANMSAMDHSSMSTMNHSAMAAMNHSSMSTMDHSSMDHSGMSAMDHSSMGTMDHSSMGHSMKMWFHFGANEVILFESWKVHNAGSMVWTCAVILLFCFVMELIRWYRKFNLSKQSSSKSCSMNGHRNRIGIPQVNPWICLDSVLHVFQLTLSYVLMLLFMTYNLWICFACVFGEVISRFIFTVFLPLNNEACIDQDEAVATCCG